MTDIRIRLTDALQKAAYPSYSGGAPCGTALPLDVAVDVLLSLPGIAIVDSVEYGLLMDVARMYVNAFTEDETMTFPDRLALQRVEDIVAAANAAEGDSNES